LDHLKTNKAWIIWVTHQEKILSQASKWKEAGVSTYACRFDLERRYQRSFIKITDEIIKDHNLLPQSYNFLAIDLENSDISCLDIEGNPGSVECFMKMMEEKSINLSDFIVEKTINNGLHVYFSSGNNRKRDNIFAMELKTMKFDVLYRGKAFTFPSYLGEKRYVPMFNIEENIRREKIVDMPSCISGLFTKK
jgi:hypothetical protein